MIILRIKSFFYSFAFHIVALTILGLGLSFSSNHPVMMSDNSADVGCEKTTTGMKISRCFIKSIFSNVGDSDSLMWLPHNKPTPYISGQQIHFMRLFFLVLLLPICAMAQVTQNIVGEVVDSESQFPLPGVTVQLISDSAVTATDFNGIFEK